MGHTLMGAAAILRAFGFALMIVGAGMVIPFTFAESTGSGAGGPYLFGLLTSFLVGAGFYVAAGSARPRVDFRGGLLLAFLWWTGAPVLGAVPFVLSGFGLAEAYFEAVSALTTTGAWLYPERLAIDPAGQLWRAVMQWLGGLASISIAAAIIVRPVFFGLETLQLPFSRGERASYLHSLRNALKTFVWIYGALTFTCFLLLAMTGLRQFDAAVFALSLVSSGGMVPGGGSFATADLAVVLIAVPFMVLSGANFIVLSFAARGAIRKVRDSETVTFLWMIVGVGFLFWFLAGAGDVDLVIEQLFNAASLLSTHGALIGEAPPFAVAAVAALIGGASISAAGGIKVLRWLVIFRRAREEIRGLISPNEVQRRTVIEEEFGVWMHFLVFTLLLAAVVLMLMLSGHGFPVATAAATAALSNTGPLLIYGVETPDVLVLARYDIFATVDQLLLCAVMILGRIEAVAILALINPAFWRS